MDTFLNTPLRGLTENSQPTEATSSTPPAHQLSTALGLDYERLWDDFRSLFEAQSLPGEFDYVTPAIVCEWAKTHGHSCYFVKHGTLLYKMW